MEDLNQKAWQSVDLRDEDRVRVALHDGKEGCVDVVKNGTDEIVHVGKDVCEKEGGEGCADPCSNKPFNGFLRRDGDQLRLSKGDTTQVGEDVVDHHQACRHYEPEHAVQNVADDAVALENHQQKCHVGDAQLRKLELERPLAQRGHKPDKAGDVHAVAEELVVHHELDRNDAGVVRHNEVRQKVLDQISSVEVEDRGDQEPPVQGLCVLQVLQLRSVRGDVDTLSKHRNLDEQHHHNGPELSCRQRRKQEHCHDQRPYGTENEGLFLLLPLVYSPFLAGLARRRLRLCTCVELEFAFGLSGRFRL